MKLRHIGLNVIDLPKYVNELVSLGFRIAYIENELWLDRSLLVIKMVDTVSFPKPLTIELVKGEWYDHECYEVSEKVLIQFARNRTVLHVKSDDNAVVYIVKNGDKYFELYCRKGK